jgi:hypothetical protein
MADGIIRNIDLMRQQHYRPRGMQWAFMRGCFDCGIMPSDVDGIVERNGHYLVFEEKSLGVGLGTGQRRLLLDLCVSKSMTVFILWGNSEEPFFHEMMVWYPPKHFPHLPIANAKPFAADVAEVKHRCRAWFEWADSVR